MLCNGRYDCPDRSDEGLCGSFIFVSHRGKAKLMLGVVLITVHFKFQIHGKFQFMNFKFIIGNSNNPSKGLAVLAVLNGHEGGCGWLPRASLYAGHSNILQPHPSQISLSAGSKDD